MAKSMTAYGRSSLVKESEIWTLEIFSVNKRNLEFFVSLPKELLFLDPMLRKRMSALVTRGQITLKLSRQTNAHAELPANLTEQLTDLKIKWEAVTRKLGLNAEKEISLKFLLENLGDFDFITEEYRNNFVANILEELFDRAYAQYDSMKSVEGGVLEKDIMDRLNALSSTLDKLEEECKNLPEKYKAKLQERLKGLSGLEEDVEERVAKELAFIVEKMDVTEEIVRFKSHLMQMKDLLLSKERSIGKAFDFLLQETFREVNTLGTKALDLSAIKLTLILKNELEKIREQIQNIE